MVTTEGRIQTTPAAINAGIEKAASRMSRE